MKAGTMTDFDKWQRARKRRQKIAAEEMRKAMTEAWTKAARYNHDPDQARSEAWNSLCGWLRGMESCAGISHKTDPDGMERSGD